MVWAIVDNVVSFGQCSPQGDYPGREKQVLDYYNSGMSEAEKDDLGLPNHYPLLAFLVEAASRKFTEDRGPLRPHEQPVEFVTRKSYPSLAALIEIKSGLLAVDEALKALIEEFEPGVHQFWPIRIKMPRGDYNAGYNYSASAKTQKAAVQMQTLLHMGPHDSYSDAVENLIKKIDEFPVEERPSRMAKLIYFLEESRDPGNLSGGGKTGGYTSFTSRRDP